MRDILLLTLSTLSTLSTLLTLLNPLDLGNAVSLKRLLRFSRVDEACCMYSYVGVLTRSTGSAKVDKVHKVDRVDNSRQG